VIKRESIMSDLYVPEISYDDMSIDEIQAWIISAIETKLGRTLAPSDPLRLFAMAFLAEDINIRNLLDEAARQNLLAYATNRNLDALGDLVGTSRLLARGATTTIRFTAESSYVGEIIIPQGTRVTPDGDIIFATIYPMVINTESGTTFVDIPAVCEYPGSVGNGYLPGQINTIVDPIPGIVSAANIDTSSGGANTESDEDYRQRIRLAPTQYSVAGSRGAYEYWARSASPAIIDARVTSPSPGYVDVYVLLQGGELPDATMLAEVDGVLNGETIRPMTDFVTVKAPVVTNYTLNITYYINLEDAARAAEIQAAVNAAVDGWVLWQKSAIGRDINPSELISRVMAAGVRRVVVMDPAYTVVPNNSVAILSGSAIVTYGGLEAE
jgi:phage-related baseplate assembly protein